MIQLAIKNYIVSATKISSFFLFYSYELDTIQMKLSQIKENLNGKFSKFWADTVISKMKDIIKFAQTVMINVQQEQECQINCHCQKSPQLCVNDKVWLTIEKQYSTRRPNWKLDYKNQKYIVTEIVSPHAVCLNIEDVYLIFHVDWLHLAADDPLLSQPQSDDQLAPIYVKSKKEWYIDEIVTEKLCHHDCDVIKWFQIKYTDYAIPEWNQATNMKNTTTLKQWMKHMREFQNIHSRLPDSFQHESCPRWTLWHCAAERGSIVTG